jgi:hypothetical protein
LLGLADARVMRAFVKNNYQFVMAPLSQIEPRCVHFKIILPSGRIMLMQINVFRPQATKKSY